MTTHILLGFLLAVLLVITWHRPSRRLVGMTFQALVCLLCVAFMNPRGARA